MNILQTKPTNDIEEAKLSFAMDLYDEESFVCQILEENLQEKDIALVRSEFVDFASGTISEEELKINCLAYTDTDEQLVNNALLEILAIFDEITRRTVAHIDANPTKESLLAEIEGDNSSAENNFALPRSKPSVMDVLSSAIIKPDESTRPTPIDAESLGIVDPFKKPDAPVKTSDGGPMIFDPFKIADAKPKLEKAKIVDDINRAQVANIAPRTPAAEIKQNLENKLTSVVASPAKETFKSADPYREAVDSK